MNSIHLSGRTTKDVELRYTSNNKPVVVFTIAVNREYKNSEGNYDTDFFNCSCFNNAENIKKYVSKGDKIIVEGRVENRTYDDKDGNKRYVTEIRANRVEFIESKKNTTTTETENNQSNTKSGELTSDEQIWADFGNSVEISDEDIAF